MARKEQRHVQVLEEAFSQVVSSRETLKVSTKGGIVLSLNKSLMLLHSPLLRSISSSTSLSFSASSLVILPDSLPSALLAVEQLLERGSSVQTGAAPWQVFGIWEVFVFSCPSSSRPTLVTILHIHCNCIGFKDFQPSKPRPEN